MRHLLLLFFILPLSLPSSAKEQVSLLIKNGQLLTMDQRKTIYQQGVIAISGNRIIAVGGDDLLTQYSGENVIDANNGIVMPGMVNSHNHLPMIAFRGLGEEGIENRLFAYFFPLEGEKLSRDLIYKTTIHGTIDMAMSGVTTYADMYYHMDEMAKATKVIGLRGVLGETVIKFPVVDASEPYGGLAYAKKFINAYQDDELITPAFAPHSAYGVSKEKLLEIKRFADEHATPIMIHSGEFADEANRIAESNGVDSPVTYLDKIGFLDEKVLLAHASHMSDDDIAIVKKHKVGIAYNPMANAKGATGIARIHEMQDSGITKIGLGTDGPMSSNQVDLFRVLSYAANMQRIKYNNRTIMTPDIVVEMATMGGARALNLDKKIGSLEVGKLADIIIIETTSPNMVPNYNPYATLVFQGNPSNVDTTIVNGKIIVEGKQLKTYDIAKNQHDMQQISADIGAFANELAKKAKSM